ncbi:MAG: hypothetical protein V5A72_01150 [Candidatus Nanohaloarchaea archaeon]
MPKTVNLSKVKVSPRQKRAKKAVSLLRETFSDEVKISSELNEKIWSKGMQNPPTKITVENKDGVLYPRDISKDTTQEEEGESSSDSDSTDYEDVVSGTIDEAKEKTGELDRPDFEALIDAEASNKDRKTLKEWFEEQR